MNRPLLASISQLSFSVIGKASFLIVTLLLYKARSQEEMGAIALMLAIAMILATISECGMRGLLVREMARMSDEPDQATRLMGGAMQSRLYSLLPYLFSAAAAGAVLLPTGYAYVFASILFAVWFDSNGQVFRGALRAYNRLIMDAALAAAPKVALLGVCSLLYFNDDLSLTNFASVYALIAVGDFFISQLFVFRYTAVRLSFGTTHSYTMNLIKRGLPFIILAVLGTIYMRVGVVLLSVPKTPKALTEAAAYSLSAKFPEGVAFIPVALMNVAIPFLARESNNLDAIRTVFGRLEMLAGGAGLLISVGLIAFAEELILLLSTPAYLPYAHLFRLYGLAVFFSFVQYTYANLLLCMNKEHLVASRYGAILILNVVLNLLMIWLFGAIGAVAAFLICEIAGVCVDLYFLRGTKLPLTPKVLVTWIAIGAVAVAIAAFVKTLHGELHLILYGILAGGVGAALLIFTQKKRYPAQDLQT